MLMSEQKGWMQFFSLPDTLDGDLLKMHLSNIEGVVITKYIPDLIAEALIQFEYKGYSFQADTRDIEWGIYVFGSNCPEEIMRELNEHCAMLVGHFT